ncbi:hypothetical protein FRB96_009322 [Tulasnella sp. 330]|nr:hypothetical protein FRB96_009322 [Tulasnella sp. 330]KAG8885234.1 hypothetical protein FRB97_001680 [Tulasnella sp. 331]KAG8887608.1 hypothetical protein FRB98_009336 [Tulasnella sp. 332]
MPALTIITEIPHFVSKEDHAEITTRTPESFSDIPPVLRRKDENVRVELEPALPNLAAQDLTGTLYVLESVLVFMAPSGKGFQIEYPKITLHAISRGIPGPSIYCQLDEQADDAGEIPEDEDSEMSELSIFPAEATAVDGIFEALSSCASLHPDLKTPGDELDEEGGFSVYDENSTTFEVFTGGPDEELSEVGRAALAHFNIISNDFVEGEDEGLKSEAVEDAPIQNVKEGSTKVMDAPKLNGTK